MGRNRAAHRSVSRPGAREDSPTGARASAGWQSSRWRPTPRWGMLARDLGGRVKILCVDDHELFRDGLRSALSGLAPQPELVEAQTGQHDQGEAKRA